jgi:hypothetical protein
MEGRPTGVAAEVCKLTGYTLIATCDALLGVWRMEKEKTNA